METRTRLIAAAEKLFGERGLHGVTLKEITKAAGQKNESALHYHFGSKTKLVEAILHLRVGSIDRYRAELVDLLEDKGWQDRPRDVIWAAMEPLAAMLATKEGAQFVRFLAQAISEPKVNIVAVVFDPEYRGMRRIGEMLQHILQELPVEVSMMRRRMLVEMMVQTLAGWSRHHPVSTAIERALFVSNLIDAAVGFLTAPVSFDTLLTLKAATRSNDNEEAPIS